jgi:hypothetical protein
MEKYLIEQCINIGNLYINRAKNFPLSKHEWTYSDWEKKDPTALIEMYKNDNGRYQALLNKWKQK